MKRPRTADGLKARRAMKKTRLGEGFCSGGLIYVKLLVAWALLIVADFLLGFRFEYLWPFWLLMRSIYDSFRYQGLAFSVFFVCVTVTSDLVCFLFIPIQWLFFLASTYVWVQYVWHADRGICLPTVAVWLLFLYVEASVRVKEFSSLMTNRGFSFTLDICRPFAAHCIGYPMVTMGFGVKSYVGYKLRARRQRDVARKNEVYWRLLAESQPTNYVPPSVIPRPLITSVQSSADIGDLQSKLMYDGSDELVALTNGDLSNYGSSSTNGSAPSYFAPQSPYASTSLSSHQQLINNSNLIGGKSQYRPTMANAWSDGPTKYAAGGLSYLQQQQAPFPSSGNATPSQLPSWLSSLWRRLPGFTELFGTYLGSASEGGNAVGGQHSATTHSSRSSQVDDESDDDDRDSSRGSIDTVPTSSGNGVAISAVKNRRPQLAMPTKAGGRSRRPPGAQLPPTPIANKLDNNQLYMKDNGQSIVTTMSTKSVHSGDTSAVDECVELQSECHSTTSRSASVDAAVSSSKSNGDKQLLVLQQQQQQREDEHKERTQIVSKASSLRFSLQTEITKLKSEVRESRSIEKELRQQIHQFQNSDATLRADVKQLRTKNETLETKLQNIKQTKEQEKASMQAMEKRLAEEQRQRRLVEDQLVNEKKQKKMDEAAAAKALEKATKEATKIECGPECKSRKRDLDGEVRTLRREMRDKQDSIIRLESELLSLRQYKEAHNAEILMTALSTMKEKNLHLEQALSAENRLKQDLFMALGEAKKQLESFQSQVVRKDTEIERLVHRLHAMDGSGPALTPPPPAPSMSIGGTEGINGAGVAPSVLPTAMQGSSVLSEPSLELLTNAMYNAAAAYRNNPYGLPGALTAMDDPSSPLIDFTNPAQSSSAASGANNASRMSHRMSFTPPRQN